MGGYFVPQPGAIANLGLWSARVDKNVYLGGGDNVAESHGQGAGRPVLSYVCPPKVNKHRNILVTIAKHKLIDWNCTFFKLKFE
jgi:hypothetical protein